MNEHEPECNVMQTWGMAMTEKQRNLATQNCGMCSSLRAAYYRGREDAANAVLRIAAVPFAIGQEISVSDLFDAILGVGAYKSAIPKDGEQE